MKRYLVFLLAGGLFLVAGSCSLISLDEEIEAGIYPTIFPEIPIDSLIIVNEAYQLSNGENLCSTLNEYGFTGFSRILATLNPRDCFRMEGALPELPIVNFVTIAKSVITQNQKFTNVIDTLALVVLDSEPFFGCTICEGPNRNNVPVEWRVRFGPQVLGSSKVINSEITVFIDAFGVSQIWGNHFQNFIVPDRPNFSFEEIRQSILDGSLKFPEGIDTSEIFFSNETVSTAPIQEIVPLSTAEGLEMRKAWKFEINNPEANSILFIFYVDIIEGKVLNDAGRDERSSVSDF